jgi:hypothetical protein
MNNKKNKKQGLGAFQLGGVKFNGFHVNKLQSGGFFEDFGVIEWLMFSVVFIIIIVILLVLVNILFGVNMDDIPLIGSITSLIGDSNPVSVPETSAAPATSAAPVTSAAPATSAATTTSPTSAFSEAPNNSTNTNNLTSGNELTPYPPLKENMPNQLNGGKLRRYKNLR